MNALSVIVLLATVGYSFAYLGENCATDGKCGGVDECCVLGKRCGPKLPVGFTCYLSNRHGCGCVVGSSCKPTFTITLLNKTYNLLYQCVKDTVQFTPQELLETSNDKAERARRFLIRKCTTDTVASDCGKERCCLGDKYCSPLLPKYIPCNFKNSHKCPCVDGLVCKETQSLNIPGLGISLLLKQCMPADEIVNVEEVELTEN